MTRWITCLVLALFMTSCYRTHYANFSAQNPERAPAAATSAPVRSQSGWQNFFLWGWVPGEERIDARQECGGAANVDSIQTRRTFLEGLVAAIAGFYINIYSPWDGAVYCTQRPQ